MPVIRSHHARDTWRPRLDWPDDMMVQWGGSGLVLSREGARSTAFFEAFPGDGSAGFIRGEGETVDAAEADAHRRWSSQLACSRAGGHRWTRTPNRRFRRGKPLGTYTNGGCFCLRCGAFRSAMPPVVELGAWRAPLEALALSSLASGMLRRSGEPRRDRYVRGTVLRARSMGIPIPDPPMGVQGLFDEPDAYALACRKAVREWLLERGLPARDRGEGGMSALFSSMSEAMLRSLLAEHD